MAVAVGPLVAEIVVGARIVRVVLEDLEQLRLRLLVIALEVPDGAQGVTDLLDLAGLRDFLQQRLAFLDRRVETAGPRQDSRLPAALQHLARLGGQLDGLVALGKGLVEFALLAQGHRQTAVKQQTVGCIGWARAV